MMYQKDSGLGRKWSGTKHRRRHEWAPLTKSLCSFDLPWVINCRQRILLQLKRSLEAAQSMAARTSQALSKAETELNDATHQIKVGRPCCVAVPRQHLQSTAVP